MNISGKLIPGLVLLTLALVASSSHAAVTAIADRNQVFEGDSLTLVIKATDDENIAQTDFSALERDFQIINQSSRSSTNILNGKRESSKELIVEIIPLHSGQLAIPAFTGKGWQTNPITVDVQPAPATTGGDDVVQFSAEVDRDNVYVQGQLLLTLRLQQAINLDNRSVSELDINGAFIVALEQQSFQRQLNGRTYLIHELRYAVFPEQSGTLTIPAQVFTGRQRSPRRTLFDRGGNGQSMRRSTEPLTITVLPRPTDYTAPTWLPAKQMTIEETWSTAPEDLAVGQSATRSITLTGTGLQAAQLPPVLLSPIAGLKYYPDQPVLEDQEDGFGITGTRKENAALIPTAAGSYTIPELRIPWWNTDKQQIEIALIPARTITVRAGATTTNSSTPITSQVPLITTVEASALPQPAILPWQIATSIAVIGWILTTIFLLRKKQSGPNSQAQLAARQASERTKFRALKTACRSANAATTRQALLDWGRAYLPEQIIGSTEELATTLADPVLGSEIEVLNSALYGPNTTHWNGDELLVAVKVLRKQHNRKGDKQSVSLQLYPAN